MRIVMSKKNLINYFIAVVICLFASSGQLISYIIPTVYARTAIVIILLGISVVGVAKRKLDHGGSLLLVLSMLLVYVKNNYLLHSGNWFLFLIFILMLALYYMSKNRIDWAAFTLKYMQVVYLVHAICTIIFRFTPGFYKRVVVHLFPGNVTKLITLYNNNCMSGLTSHYSTNAMFLSVGLIIGISKLFQPKKDKTKEIIYVLIMVIALLLTGKRAHIIFASMAVLGTYYFYSVTKKNRLINIIGVLLCALCIGAIVFTAVPALGTFITRFQTTIDSGDITQNRTMFWQLAYKLFKEHKLTGIGWNNFSVQSLITYDYIAHVHNVYLQLLCETGIIGFTIYVFWMLYNMVTTILLYKKIRIRNITDSKILTLLNFSLCYQIFFMLYCFTGNPLYDYETFIPYFMGCAINFYYNNALRYIIK